MTLIPRGDRWGVEVYDPTRRSKKRWVGTFHGNREARKAERVAQAQVAQRRGKSGDETVASFAARWLDLRPRQKETTNLAYAEQVKLFAVEHGALRLREVDVELALTWVVDHRWMLGGLRAMFSDARRVGLCEGNPFAGLRLRGAHGRRDLDVLSRPEVERLADCAREVWGHDIGANVRALILVAGFVGMRPAELYGLRWSDIDFRDDEVRVERQYVAKTKTFELPKNGQKRRVVLTAPAKAALLELPRPVDSARYVFHAKRGGPMTGRVQHYYWHPVRSRFGRPSMDLYELRHFCAAWLLNDLELPAQDVAHQLGHTDGGALVQRLYGHPSEKLARERIKRAASGLGGSVSPIASNAEANERQAGA